MLWHAVKSVCTAPIENVFVVLAPEDRQFAGFDWSAFAGRLEPLYCGGATRRDSVYNGMVAAMAEALDLQGTERVLEIGTGSGYQAAVLAYRDSAEKMARAVKEEVARWEKEGEQANMPTLRRIERLIDVPQYGRDRFRKALVSSFDLKGQRSRPLHTRHPLLEEAIQRALLPAWGDVNKMLDTQSEGLVEGLVSTGWKKGCARHLVEYAHKFSVSRREKKGEQKPTWYS